MNANTSKNSNQAVRPPVVAVLGHVDHGKTSLLDYIRKENVAAREAGGITQATSAYEIEHAGKKLTFIDTPGHEAFSAMRSRGASAADLAILVVAADDGVKPQTKESITILQQAKVPFVVAINKIDKNNADPERAKRDLLDNGVYLEGLGGDVSYQEISATTGQGVSELLDLLLLASEMEELTFDPAAFASGIVIESRLNKQRGNEVAVVIKNGTLHRGEDIATPSACGKVKILEDFKGKNATELFPSAPALIIGFENLPKIGEEFTAGPHELLIPQDDIIKRPDRTLAKSVDPDSTPALKLMVKADTAGSLEALTQILSAIKIEDCPSPIILSSGLGEISDGDIKQALTMGALVIGFNTKINKSAENLARDRVEIITSKIIYELVKSIEDKLTAGKLAETVRPVLKVLATFNQAGRKQTIGGLVIEGALKEGNRFEIRRGDESEIIGQGKIINLQCNKQEVRQVEKDKECGLVAELSSDASIEKGDELVVII